MGHEHADVLRQGQALPPRHDMRVVDAAHAACLWRRDTDRHGIASSRTAQGEGEAEDMLIDPEAWLAEHEAEIAEARECALSDMEREGILRVHPHHGYLRHSRLWGFLQRHEPR